MRKRHPEDDLQIAVAQYLDLMGWLYAHVPNGGRRGKIEAARFKGLGVKAGVPDLLIFENWEGAERYDGTNIPRFYGHGLALELKRPVPPGGKKTYPNKNQREWLAALKTRGWYTAVCRSLAEVEDVCKLIRKTPHA